MNCPGSLQSYHPCLCPSHLPLLAEINRRRAIFKVEMVTHVRAFSPTRIERSISNGMITQRMQANFIRCHESRDVDATARFMLIMRYLSTLAIPYGLFMIDDALQQHCRSGLCHTLEVASPQVRTEIYVKERAIFPVLLLSSWNSTFAAACFHSSDLLYRQLLSRPSLHHHGSEERDRLEGHIHAIQEAWRDRSAVS
jgi:hypothetical protein